MMKFDDTNNLLKEIEKEIRNIMIKYGYIPLRADDNMYKSSKS